MLPWEQCGMQSQKVYFPMYRECLTGDIHLCNYHDKSYYFAGSLVPLKYLNDIRVKSVMIELNRRIYDNHCSFAMVQELCKRIYEELR